MSKNKKPEVVKEVAITYPTDSIIILFNTITNFHIITNELKQNGILIADRQTMIFTEDQVTNLMSNAPGIWNSLNEILNRPQTPQVTGKGKGGQPPAQNKAKNAGQPVDINVPLNCPPFFANQKVMVIRIQSKNCVQTINDLLGPINPMEYTEKCLRKQFISDFPVSIYTSPKHEISIKDIEYIYVKIPLSLTEEKPIDKSLHQSEQVSPIDFFNFVFPSELAFPNSTYRMFAFALLGPFAKDGGFSGGRKGNYKMNPTDLNSYITSLMSEDIASIYLESKIGLSKNELDKIVSNADYKVKYFKPYTREELEILLDNVPLDKDECYSFHSLQKRILEIRSQRIKDLKLMFPPLITKKNRYNYPTLNKLFPRLDDVACFSNTANLVNKHSSEVMDIGTNDYLVKSNVTLLRTNYLPSCTKFDPTGFHSEKALTGTRKGTYVKKSYQVQNK